METLGHLIHGFAVSTQPYNLLFCFLGGLGGTLVGVLPGLGPQSAIVLLLPAAVYLEPVTAIIMLAGVYYGSMYGGSTTSILVNIPGEGASVASPPPSPRMGYHRPRCVVSPPPAGRAAARRPRRPPHRWSRARSRKPSTPSLACTDPRGDCPLFRGFLEDSAPHEGVTVPRGGFRMSNWQGGGPPGGPPQGPGQPPGYGAPSRPPTSR